MLIILKQNSCISLLSGHPLVLLEVGRIGEHRPAVPAEPFGQAAASLPQELEHHQRFVKLGGDPLVHLVVVAGGVALGGELLQLEAGVLALRAVVGGLALLEGIAEGPAADLAEDGVVEDLVGVEEGADVVEHHKQIQARSWRRSFILSIQMSREASRSASPPRKIDVILLTNPRSPNPELRCSAFKATEADHQDRPCDASPLRDSLVSLARRVSRLQQRVQQLQDFRESPMQEKGRKRRRRFQQMLRDVECQLCGKSYGSETALKYHCRLKHNPQP